MKKVKKKEQLGVNISYPQVRQPWFSVGIFPLGPFFGLTGNRPQSAPACSFLRCCQLWLFCERLCEFDEKRWFVVF
jgi:hypothetical protein